MNQRRSVEKAKPVVKTETYLATFGKKNVAVTCLLATWQPSLSWHDSYLGLFMEHGKSYYSVKERPFK